VTGPTLSILIATLGQRRDLLGRLLFGLMPQVEQAAGRVKVIAYWDNGDVDLATKRQTLVESCDTDYLCFVDDDDTVTDDYVVSVLAALDGWPDFVGLWMNVHKDGADHRLAELSLKHDHWYDGPTHYCRDITHENPLRTSIARRVDFREKDPDEPEDSPWADKLRPLLAGASESMIDKVLYHYWWVPGQSAWGKRRIRIGPTDHRGKPWRPLPVRSQHFAWHPASTFSGDLPMTELLVVVPSRTRPQNVRRLVDAWRDTGALGVASMRVDIDADDPEFRGYLRLAESFPRGVRLAVGHRWRSLVWKLNRATRQECESYFALGFMGDDHLPRTQGWVQRYLDELHELRTGIVYGDDGYQHENTPTQWAMTSDICRALGGRMVPAPVDHLYCDDAVRDLGKLAGCLRYLPDVTIEHMHPSAGKAQRDEQYVRVNSQAQYGRDRPAYCAWRESLDDEGLGSQAERVHSLRSPLATVPAAASERHEET
jgi:hypothetical protein